MNTSVIATAFRRAPTLRSASVPRSLLLRASLVAACLMAMVVAADAGALSTLLRDDPELAGLLRGMAVIKALIALVAAAAAAWRFGRPVARPVAAAYVVAIALMAGATVAIWQLSSLAPAAVAFHVGLFALLLVALRDDGAQLPRRTPRA